jgi:CHAT domain-containing protein
LVEDLEAVSSGKQALEILKTRGAEIDLLYFIGHGGQKVQGDTLSTVLSLEDRPLGAADFFRRDFRLRPGAVGLFSCCLVGRTESGLGKELTGFLRGLFYSGLSTVVAPLWSVEDETAAALMPAVCASLASGSALGVALREAVQWIRHDFSHSEIGRGVAHPYFWASYQPWGR